jgi:hypothetical protein
MKVAIEQAAMRKIYLRLLPFAFICYSLCYIDRINITNTARPYMTPRSGILSRQGIGYPLYVVYNVAVLVVSPDLRCAAISI